MEIELIARLTRTSMFSRVDGGSEKIKFLILLHSSKSSTIRSGDLAEHVNLLPLPIHLFGKRSLKMSVYFGNNGNNMELINVVTFNRNNVTTCNKH